MSWSFTLFPYFVVFLVQSLNFCLKSVSIHFEQVWCFSNLLAAPCLIPQIFDFFQQTFIWKLRVFKSLSQHVRFIIENGHLIFEIVVLFLLLLKNVFQRVKLVLCIIFSRFRLTIGFLSFLNFDHFLIQTWGNCIDLSGKLLVGKLKFVFFLLRSLFQNEELLSQRFSIVLEKGLFCWADG